MTVERDLTEQFREKRQPDIPISEYHFLLFIFRVGRSRFTARKFLYLLEYVRGNDVIFPELRPLHDVLHGKVHASGGSVEVGAVVFPEVSPEYLHDLHERLLKERDGHVMDHVAAQEQIDGHGAFLGLEVLLPAGYAVHGKHL
ncbi:MAG: hypothetical protein IKA00_14265, partial [Prevotella sp.]|nr:hypothetical protein [Prevotella sp.]